MAGKKKAKPKRPTRPSVTHGGVRVEIPLLSGPVGAASPELTRTYPVFNAAADIEVVAYYLSELAAIHALSTTCAPVLKPSPQVIQAAGAAQCWESNLGDAIKAFQTRMEVGDAEEKRLGFLRPDGPTLKALVDYGDLAERLEARASAKKNPHNYIYSGGFDEAAFFAEYDKQISDYRLSAARPYGVVNRGQLSTLLRLMAADKRIIDIRWMAYMLATVHRETGGVLPARDVPQVDKSGAPLLDKNKKPIIKKVRDPTVYAPIEEGGHGAGRNYHLAVKVSRLPDGRAYVMEADGQGFTVNLDGTYVADKKTFTVGASDAAFSGKGAASAFTKDGGVELAYFGRGYVQLTWWSNYASTGAAIGRGLTLLYDPELAKQPEIAYQVMAHGMLTGDGFANGRRFAQYFAGATTNYVGARAMVNGSDHAAEIAAMAEKFEAALFAARVTP